MATDPLGALSLPEAIVMIGSERVDAHEVVFLALLELVVRGGVELVAPAGTQDEYRLIPANKYVRRAFGVRWGTAEAYVRLEVWSRLRERGLSGTNERRRIAAIWDLTTSGKAEPARILGCGTAQDWRDRPATTLPHAAGLAVPRGKTFDILDEVEEQITPGVTYNPVDAFKFGPNW